MDTGNGRVFYNRTARIEEKELSKMRLETFGDAGPWRDFTKEVEAIFQEMKEPSRSFQSNQQSLQVALDHSHTTAHSIASAWGTPFDPDRVRIWSLGYKKIHV